MQSNVNVTEHRVKSVLGAPYLLVSPKAEALACMLVALNARQKPGQHKKR
jgi:hypothetical protein